MGRVVRSGGNPNNPDRNRPSDPFRLHETLYLARAHAWRLVGRDGLWVCRVCAERAALLPQNFPKKNRGFNFFGLGKTPDLLRSRLRVPVRETFTGMLGSSDFQKARDTATAQQEEESIAQATRSRVKQRRSAGGDAILLLYLTMLCEYLGIRKSTRYRRNHHRGKSAYNRAAMWGTGRLDCQPRYVTHAIVARKCGAFARDNGGW